MFRRILIANRGEIAVRIAQTVQEMGITAAVVYSRADRDALHVSSADEAYPLDGVTPGESYLRGDRIIEIAREHDVDAIHPGYGFLSENADFAASCRKAGITFIGPDPDVIRAMGDKTVAKKKMEAAGVPVVPGCGDVDSADPKMITQQAAQIGYPVLVKAAAGGGGKGMRLVRDEGELPASIEAAQREAGSAFGDSRVFLEKYIERPRHVEVQIFGDDQGHVVHLFERECSIQRRHQKIVEEAPCVALTPELRKEMGEAAVRAAQAMGYQGAGTVEFMLDQAHTFYFLEVNTRLQVEHPVTEMTVHHDLVRAQILVAAGEPLPFEQADLHQNGCAIECRIYAEDAARGFLPSVGTIVRYVPPVGPNIRVDSGVREGSEVSVHYDPMLAKLICWGQTRPQALQKMSWALRNFVILGVTTNLEFLGQLIAHPEFIAGRLHTQFLEEHAISGDDNGKVPDEALIIAAWAANQGLRSRGHHADPASSSPRPNSPWQTAGPWRAV